MKAVRLRVATALLAAFTFAAVLTLPGAAHADEADLTAALEDYAAGRYDEALEKLQGYLQTNPDSTEVYDVLRDVEDRVLIRAMAKGGDHQRAVQYLLDIARPAAEAEAMGDDEIQATARAAVESEAIADRRRASVKLRQAGDLAVPHLYPYFAADSVDHIVNALLALNQIGSRATLPLVECLQSDDARVRGYAAAAIGNIGDRRGLCALMDRAQNDSDGGVVSKAEKAIEKFGGTSGTAADAYVRTGNRYYANDTTMADSLGTTKNIWRWEDDSLARYEVPYFLWAYQMAEECASDALGLEPENGGARCLLVRAILAQKLEADARGEDAPEALAGAFDVAASQGFQAASDALAHSIAARDWDVAIECCNVMASTYGGETLADSPLGDALVAPHKHLRYSAAIAALHMSPKKGLPNADKVAALAAQAASESAVRQVLVIDDVDETRSKLMMALAHGGYVSAAESLGTAGVTRAKGAPTIDVVVIRADLGDQSNTIPAERHMTSLMAIDELTRDARTKSMSIVILVDDTPEQEKDAIKAFLSEKYSSIVGENDAYLGFIEAPVVETAALSEIATASDNKKLNEDRVRANELAARAADAFAAMDFTCRSFDLSVAIEPLSTAATDGDTPEIRLNATRALGNLRVGGADALVQVLTEGEGDELQAAAAASLGAVLSMVDGTPEQVQALIDASAGEGAVADAALKALGQVRSLTADQRNQIFQMHRRAVPTKAE